MECFMTRSIALPPAPTLPRRDFIRLLGGGAVAAATVGIAGCSTAYPSAAVAPWQGPGAEPDLRRWALGYAVLAPSAHNRQPWLVDLREPGSITLYVDRERLLPETDPWNRQIMISQGTFIEALLIALRQKNLTPQLQMFPQGEFAPRAVDERAVARISWASPGLNTTSADPLFAQLLRRSTAKTAYDTQREVPAAALAQIVAAARTPQLPRVQAAGTVEMARVQPLRELCWQASKVELGTERTVMESIRLTRVGPQEIAQHRDGISINGLMPRLAAAVGAFDRSAPPVPGSSAHKQMMARFEDTSFSAMGFVWLTTPWAADLAAQRSRSAEVEAGRAYLRLQLKATELGVQVHPMSQAAQEFAEMKPHHDALHQQLLGQPAGAQVVQMFCRIGYAAEQPHTPRRGVDAIMRA
jgi:hypothetical protein